MQTPVVSIHQGDSDIGRGRLGSLDPRESGGTEITVNDVQMGDAVEFEIGGPFKLAVEDKKFTECAPVNFRNLRPGATYDRVVFHTERKPGLG